MEVAHKTKMLERPSNCPSVNISCYRISSKTTVRIFLKLGQNVPLSV